VRLPAGDEVEALVELREQPADLARVVLAVAVDGDDDVTLGLREPGLQRRRLAEVSAQADDADVAVGGVEVRQRRERAVGRAVVDEDRLPARTYVPERVGELGEQRPDAQLLVSHRDDDADHGG
jgi:hypothetical protein